MTLAELGAKLREAREARNMTVADVADHLKIPGRILQGVEEASERLPRTVYVHHFIKDYAKLMGFSQAEIAEWMNSLEGFENILRPNLSESQPFTSVKPSLLPVILSGALKLVLLAALAFGAYSAYVHFLAGRDYEDIVNVPAQEQAVPATPAEPQAASVWEPVKSAASKPAPSEKDSAPAEQTASETASSVVSSEAPVWDAPAAQPESEPAVTQAMEAPAGAPAEGKVAPEAEKTVVPAGVSASAEAGSPAGQPLHSEGAGSAPVPAAVPASEEGQGASSTLAALPEGMHHVEVIADGGDCWMGFEPDGRKQQRTLRKGDSFTMSFRDSLVMKLGAASSVRVIYDGKELPRSTSGRVVTMSFPPAE